MLCTKACKEGIGGIVTQYGLVVCYKSRNPREHEKKHVTHNSKHSSIIIKLNSGSTIPLRV